MLQFYTYHNSSFASRTASVAMPASPPNPRAFLCWIVWSSPLANSLLQKPFLFWDLWFFSGLTPVGGPHIPFCFIDVHLIIWKLYSACPNGTSFAVLSHEKKSSQCQSINHTSLIRSALQNAKKSPVKDHILPINVGYGDQQTSMNQDLLAHQSHHVFLSRPLVGQ